MIWIVGVAVVLGVFAAMGGEIIRTTRELNTAIDRAVTQKLADEKTIKSYHDTVERYRKRTKTITFETTYDDVVRLFLKGDDVRLMALAEGSDTMWNQLEPHVRVEEIYNHGSQMMVYRLTLNVLAKEDA